MIKRLAIGIILFLFLLGVSSFSQEEKKEEFGREDPFRPLIPWKHLGPKRTPTEFLLRAVFLDTDPRAILESGERSYLVKEGDLLEGKRVKEIKSNEVILEEGRKKYFVEFGKVPVIGKEPVKSEETESSD